jgi:hypothetical protein
MISLLSYFGALCRQKGLKYNDNECFRLSFTVELVMLQLIGQRGSIRGTSNKVAFNAHTDANKADRDWEQTSSGGMDVVHDLDMVPLVSMHEGYKGNKCLHGSSAQSKPACYSSILGSRQNSRNINP